MIPAADCDNIESGKTDIKPEITIRFMKQQGDPKVLIAAMITSFMTTFMSSALNLSIPSLESYFSVSAAAVAWIVSSYTISVAAMSLPFGKIADITSRRTVFLIGIAGFFVLSISSIFVKHIALLIAFRALMGACGAMIFATNNALLITSYPIEVRGKMIGLSTAATYIGLTAGPVVGGILNSSFGWRSIFAVSAAVSMIAFTAASRAALSERKNASTAGNDTRRHHIDKTGALLYIFAIIASLYGMSNFTSGIVPVVMLISGIIAMIAFFRYESRLETRNEEPVMKVTMFSRSRTFTFSSLAALLNYGATFAISYTVSIFLQVILGISSDKAGLILICMPALQAIFSPLMGSLSDRIRPSILASIGMGICAITLVLFSRLSENASITYIIFALCLTGIGFAFFSSPNTNAILGCVDKADFGVANSIIATMRTYGQSSGMAILTVITVAVLGNGSLESSPTADIIRMMHTAFLIFAGLSVVGLFFSLARDSTR